jgi:cytochrome c553
MVGVAQHVTPAEAAAAADYFSRLPLPPRVRVLERARVPRSHVAGWLRVADAGGGDEPLGLRLLEFTPDLRRHEQRDERLRYVAYVPPGSIARGRAIAHSGGKERGTACETCHGPALQGTALGPPLAGRMPGYLLRQLLAFQAGTRHAAAGVSMRAVALELELPEMIDAVAYAASLPP